MEDRMERTLRDKFGEALWLAFQDPLYPRVGWAGREDIRENWMDIADDVIHQAAALGVDICDK
jgi:hypothetical protein